MKIGISLPDELFKAAERLVRESGRSRSEVYAQALREYVLRHSSDEVTTRLNAVLDVAGESEDEERFVDEAARRALSHSEW
jgi:metal-responsive CopG/Arc/MetJ family transcriptional regulator